jgi:hypothetical protein
MQHRHRGVSELDQIWLIDELFAYLDRGNCGAGGFRDIGPSWVRVRDGDR